MIRLLTGYHIFHQTTPLPGIRQLPYISSLSKNNTNPIVWSVLRLMIFNYLF
jgi:hypothetical protein